MSADRFNNVLNFQVAPRLIEVTTMESSEPEYIVAATGKPYRPYRSPCKSCGAPHDAGQHACAYCLSPYAESDIYRTFASQPESLTPVQAEAIRTQFMRAYGRGHARPAQPADDWR